MATLKTQPTAASVTAFLNTVTDEQKRKDCFTLVQWMEEVTGARAKMWGPSIIGFGDYHYKYASGTENDWFQIGFSPRKQNIVLYVMQTAEGRPDELLEQLGKYKTGKGCVYIQRLADIDEAILKKWLRQCVNRLKKQ
jgi:hypothetical protein